MGRITLFILCTLFFLAISRKALRNPGSHGFYRFFVFEGILVLTLLNHPYWFNNPFKLTQLFSWFLLFSSLLFVIQAIVLLKKRGGYAEREDTPENFSFENTQKVVETGLYRYVRHPMYSSLLFLAWGAFLKQINPTTTLLVVVVSGFLIAAGKVEEKENLRFFGKSYQEYMRRTKMFIPGIL